MKQISLRKAKLDDLDTFRKFHEDDDAQFLYSNHDETDEVNGNEVLKKVTDDIGGYNQSLFDNDPSKIFGENLKNFINVNQVVCGYIRTEKKSKELAIRDMTISDYSILNEVYLSKLFYCLFQKTKVEKIIIYFCNGNNAKMLQRIGFAQMIGRLEKTAGI